MKYKQCEPGFESGSLYPSPTTKTMITSKRYIGATFKKNPALVPYDKSVMVIRSLKPNGILFVSAIETDKSPVMACYLLIAGERSNRFISFTRCPWCNGYRHRIWTRRYEFNSWTRLIAFHIALIPLGKVWIQLFSLQLWVNSRAD